MFKVGDKVRTKLGVIKGGRRRGIITRINGGYIYVQLKQYLGEFYANELEKY